MEKRGEEGVGEENQSKESDKTERFREEKTNSCWKARLGLDKAERRRKEGV